MHLGQEGMTGKQRVRLAFEHREPDRVPVFEQSVCSKVASEVLGRPAFTGGGSLRRMESEMWLKGEDERAAFIRQVWDDVLALHEALGFDMVSLPWLHSAKPTKKLDEFTYLYGDLDGWFSVYRYNPTTDVFACIDDTVRHRGLDAIKEIVEDMEQSLSEGWQPDEETLAAFDYIIAKAGREKFVAAPPGFISIPMRPEWLEAIVEAPDLVHRYLDGVCEMNLIAMRVYAQHGADCFWAGGDLATNKGVIYGPKAFRQFLLPRLKRMVNLADELSVPYVFRTDGDIWSIADMLFVEAGAHGYGEIDVDAGMDLMALKCRYPHLTLWGGISCGKLLVHGTTEQIRAEVARLIEQVAPGGGYIFGSSNAIHVGVPTQNFLTMLECVRRDG